MAAEPANPPNAYPVGRCYHCGEQLESRTTFFHPGHDKLAEARVIRERWGNIPNFLLAHGYGPDNPPTPAGS